MNDKSEINILSIHQEIIDNFKEDREKMPKSLEKIKNLEKIIQQKNIPYKIVENIKQELHKLNEYYDFLKSQQNMHF